MKFLHKLACLLSIAACLSCEANDPFTLPKPAVVTNRMIILHYIDAKIMAKIIGQKNHNWLSQQGKLAFDQRTNRIWISDDKKHADNIFHLIKAWDVPIPQVLITARIVILDKQSIKQLGVYFNFLSSSEKQTVMKASLPLIHIGAAQFLDVKLTALAQQGHASIISRPSLLTSNRHAAIIESGDEIPYQERTSEGNTSTAFKKAVLRLDVTPTILPGKRIHLKIKINQDKLSPLLVNGVPAITTQQLSTEVVVTNQQTLVLGGILEHNHSQHQNSVPFLSKLPILGHLFENKHNQNSQRQLTIFITPKIIQ